MNKQTRENSSYGLNAFKLGGLGNLALISCVTYLEVLQNHVLKYGMEVAELKKHHIENEIDIQVGHILIDELEKDNTRLMNENKDLQNQLEELKNILEEQSFELREQELVAGDLESRENYCAKTIEQLATTVTNITNSVRETQQQQHPPVISSSCTH